jgi:soluble lytic murein transglycosylase-like protein
MDIRSQGTPTQGMIPLTSMIPGSSMIPKESLLTPRPVQPQEMQREAPLGFLTTPKPTDQSQTFGSSATTVPKHLEKVIQEASTISGIPAKIIQGLLFQESQFNPKAISKTGAKGIAQLTGPLLADFAKKNNAYGAPPMQVDPWNPESAIRALGYYLRFTNRKHGGDLRRAITSYNAGPWYKKPKNREQAEYFDRVLAHARRYGYSE